jgi:hypothetical protein
LALAYKPGSYLPIGTKERHQHQWADYKFDPKEYAYTNYHKWMADNGHGDREVLSSTKFSSRVVDLLTNHVGLSGVYVEKTPKGMVIRGIRFRTAEDPGIIL